MKYEDFVIGFKGNFTKRVTARDNELFAEISGDFNPLHFDDEAAREAGYGAAISNGFVTESRIAGALVKTFGSNEDLVLALKKNTKFQKPVFMDDEITAHVEVVGRIESMRILKVKAKCFNQKNEQVLEADVMIQLLKRS